MAFLELHFRSDALNLCVPVSVILPDGAKKAPEGATYRTLFLLHGLSDDHTIWERRTSIERYADERGIAVVMPEVGRSWYTDTADGANYLTYIGEELPEVCRGFFRGMSHRREDTFVAGLSMGGYGALKAALTYPDRFGGCASLSGALDVVSRTDRRLANDRERAAFLTEWRGIFGFDIERGDDLRGGRNDLFALTRKHREEGLPFPKIFLWCGTEDSLLIYNRNYHALLGDLGIPHGYAESEGNHSWKWWDLHIQDAMDALLQ